MTAGFPITEAQVRQYRAALPDAADLVVIGGGIIGICTAIFAARGGARVVLLEKGLVAAEQSSRNWGWIRQQGRDPAEIPIMVEANRLWQQFARETNEDIGLVQAGVTYLATSRAAIEGYDRWLVDARANGLDSRLLSAAEVAQMYPGMSARPAGALHTPSDLRAEPWVAVPALAEIAAREGVTIIERCAVRCLDLAAGRVAGVVTEIGRVAAPRVVLAGGAWSALFLRNHGVALPQLSVRAQVAATERLPDIGQIATSSAKLAFRRRADGGYTLAPKGLAHLYIGPDAFRSFTSFLPQLLIDPFGQRYFPAAPTGFPDAWSTKRRWSGDALSPFERMRILDPKPDAKRMVRLARDFEALFPKLGTVRLKRTWAGMIDTMPDVVPVVDHTPINGLIVGTGMSGHGFGIGPAMGRILADLAAGRAAGHDMRRFRFSRFSDGSAIVPGPDV
ncbi:FAD-binding oxidoreductase [uncultured Sulfitobacter sp.]|uniref:NAD(P)/FAD-dependent oxidoreductase n=1 Tax=uncultured Sulfitobacter sp. TaxID=191468 RepID=UPI00260FB6DD|nr:FAD-binding oxidoreductase [uncultured Sulfitobacter sp.]